MQRNDGVLEAEGSDKESRMIEALVCKSSSDPRALLALANHLTTMGKRDRALALALQARALASGDAEIHLLAGEVLNANLPNWHFSLIHDEVRNVAFDEALRRNVRPGMRVLDIGSGTGLLAMMAARAGAGAVVSCEVTECVAHAAQKIVAANGFADRIRVISKHSDVVDVERDLGGPVDVLVSEIISKDVIGEHVLQVMEDAQRFLKPGGCVIPARGSVRVALASYAGIHKMRMGTVQGFDLSAFDELGPTCLSIKRHDRGITLLSDPADLFTFEFATGGPFPEARSSLSLLAQGAGANGVAQWIRLTMDAQGEYENHPATHAATTSWAVFFYPFVAGLECRAGETIRVCGSHDRDRLRVWAERPK